MRTLVLSSLVILLSACATKQDLELSAHREFTQLRREVTVSQDPDQRAYVTCVVDSIVAAMDDPWREMYWDVEVFVSPDVNAFAMPGGKIGVFTGLLSVADDQDQLATVLGHEIAHVTENHAAATAARSQAAGIAAAVAAVGWGTGAGELVRTGADIGVLKPFSRSQESAADLVGIRYMARAGFNPLASIQLWKNMDAKGGVEPPLFLSTHPSSEDRNMELIEQMSEALLLYNAAIASGREPRCGPPPARSWLDAASKAA
jgi:predicted Zn-dependent protease